MEGMPVTQVFAICAIVGGLGEAANLRNGPRVSTNYSAMPVFAFLTREELMIAQHVRGLSKAHGSN
jgi:hypothetical protein